MLIINNKRDLFTTWSGFYYKIYLYLDKYFNMLYFYNTLYLNFTENSQFNKIV